MPKTTIAHILFDADGVLQELPGGWYAAMEPYLGERSREFLHMTWREELPTLAGEGDYRPMLAAALRDFGVTASVDDVLADVWYRIEVDQESMGLVRRLREAGYGVHLGTNQEQYRAGYMREALGYDDLFDRCFYSCELRAAKPDPAFFAQVLAALDAAAHAVLFIDDSERNVVAAREAGLAAIQWQLSDGHDALMVLLAAHGIRSSAPAC